MGGGPSELANLSGVVVFRTVDGKKKEIKVKLTDTVEPGDTIIVAERFF